MLANQLHKSISHFLSGFPTCHRMPPDSGRQSHRQGCRRKVEGTAPISRPGACHVLNINRRPYEAIVITCPDGTEIELTIHRVEGNQVKLGIEAPLDYVIDRYEVAHRKKREAAGLPLEGPEPRGPDWLGQRER